MGDILGAALNFGSKFITNYGRQRKSQQKLNKWNFENITKPQMALEQEYNEKNMALQQGYNEKNMALQNQYAIDAENRANTYNDPSSQLARARAAGMNPQALVSDAGIQGSISSAPSSDSPNSSSPSASLAGGSVSTKDFSFEGKLDILGMIQSIKKFKQDMDISREQQDNNNRLTDADIDLKNAEADRYRGQESRDSDVFSALKRSALANADSADARAAIDKIDLEIRKATKDNDIERADVSLEKMRADKKISDVTYNLYKTQIDYLKERAKTEGTQQELNQAKTKTEGTQQELNDAKSKTEGTLQELNKAKTDTEDATRDVRVINILADIGVKEAQMEEIWQKVTDLRNGVPIGNDPASAAARLIFRTIGDDKLNGQSWGRVQYRLGHELSKIFEDFDKKHEKK